MTYHLSRVMHWQQNQSLNFYPTAIQRQLAFGPWAEMAILQFQVLTNGDRLANVVQYFSLLGCAIGASYVAERLGSDRRGQALASLSVLTLPMAIVQSTSTQNDLVAAFWCIVSVAIVVDDNSRHDWLANSAWLGAAIGLAGLTKVTSFIFLAPLATWYGLRLLRLQQARSFRGMAITAAAAVLVLLPHSLRNANLYGNPLGIASGSELSGYTNEALGVRPLASNLLRTLGLQLASPWEASNATLERLIRAAHALIRIDTDDPATTWRGSSFEIVFSMYEDNAANPAHVLFILTAIIFLMRARAGPLTALWLCSFTSFVLFSLVVKWQPWNSRLILPLLIWGSTLAAVQLSRGLPGDRIFFPGLLLAAISLPYVLANPTRPLIGPRSVLVTERIQQYFANVPDEIETYVQAAGMIHGIGCRQVGLVGVPETREYLLWVTNRAVDADIRIEHVLVKNLSRRLAVDFLPCAVVVAHPYDDRTISLNGEIFVESLDTERFHLFLAAR